MRKLHVLMLALLVSFFHGVPSVAQSQQSPNGAGHRLVVKRVDPRYPDLAKKMSLGGTVKVIAVVAADGKVTKVEPVGGSPVLVEAAQAAISQWKFAAGTESRENIELHFTP